MTPIDAKYSLTPGGVLDGDSQSMITAESKPIIDAVSRMSKDFMIVGLTGRSGSGLGDLAEFMCGELPTNAPIRPRSTSPVDPSERRDLAIAEEYLRKNWLPFVKASATSAMISFLLDVERERWDGVRFRIDADREVTML